MARSVADYAAQLTALLPSGPAWRRDPAASLVQLLTGLAAEPARIDARVDDLVEEADPRTATELLPDWERVVGLPDGCSGLAPTLAERRAAATSRLTARGGQSIAYFVGLAQALGWEARVVEHVPFAADVSHAEDPLYDTPARFWWELVLHLPAGAPQPATDIGCIVQRRRPAHTIVTVRTE